MGEANVIPRRCALARAVLSFQLTISILSLGLFMTSFSGCVLPVGPRFEDPPATENYVPVIISSMPLAGSTVTAVGATHSPSQPPSRIPTWATPFTRAGWVVEYPPFKSGSSHLLQAEDSPPASSASGQPWDANPSITTSCVDPYPIGQPRHTITLFISDRPYWEPGADHAPTDRETLLTTNIEGTGSRIAQANWTLNLLCPSSN